MAGGALHGRHADHQSDRSGVLHSARDLFRLGAALYFIINGYLLGREYFELVATRRLDPRTADAMRRAHLGRVWLNGIVLALISTIPILNLLAPVISTAAMVHEFEALRTRDGLV